MQKNDFEEQMRQKMDELKIHPTEAVWPNIEASLTKRKRRRWGWLFLPFLLAGLACGGYYLTHPGTNTIKNKVENIANAANDKRTFNLSKNPVKTPFVQKNVPGKSQPETNPGKNIEKEALRSRAITPFVKIDNSKRNDIAMPKRSVLGKEMPLQNLQADKQPGVTDMALPVADNSPGQKSSPVAQIPYLQPVGKIISAQKSRPDSISAREDSQLSAVKDATAAQHKPAIDNPQKTHKVNPAAAIKLWRWGLNFSLGNSGVPKSFLGSLDKNYSSADVVYSGPPVTGVILLPSKIQSSGAFIAGLIAEKNISKKTIITIGLNYKNFGSTNKVGFKNDSLQGFALINPINTYHNHYHFIELPVALKIQLSKNKVPLFLEAGLSLSQLVSSNALQFNSNAVVYQTGNAVFYKTQAGFNTGLSLSFFSRQKASLLIGPYLYYGTSKAASEGLYKDQHFTFIGIRSQILFKN